MSYDGYGPVRVSDLLGSAKAIGGIRKPERTLEDHERYYRELADLIAFDGAGKPGFFFRAIAEYKKHIERAKAGGWTFQYAEQVWNARYERDRADLEKAMAEQDRRRSAAIRETQAGRMERGRGRGKVEPANAALFDRTEEAGAEYSFPTEGPTELFDYANNRIRL